MKRKGIERLRANGIEVIVGIFRSRRQKELIKHFCTITNFSNLHHAKICPNPDGFIGTKTAQSTNFECELSNRYVHHLSCASRYIGGEKIRLRITRHWMFVIGMEKPSYESLLGNDKIFSHL